MVRPYSLLGIIGYPVDHSLSPVMHNVALRHWDLEGYYAAFPVAPADLPQAMAGLRVLGVRGINVTIPHKRAVLPYLDRLSEEAKRIGAVNTVCFGAEGSVGHNTDGAGFLESVRREAETEVSGRVMLLLGAGGAARAVAHAAAGAGAAELIIVNRTRPRAEDLAREVCEVTGRHIARVVSYGASLEEPLQRADIVVNATSLGMKGEGEVHLPFSLLGERHLVCDLVYVPRPTTFLRLAAARGARILDGLGMLIFQGDLAFRLWTGRGFPLPAVREALETVLGTGAEEKA